MMGWGYGMGLSGWLMMGALWLVLIIAAVAAVMWIFPRDTRGRARPVAGHTTALGQAPADPLSLLAERLARGEIDVQTYRALRAELTGTDRAAR